MTAAKATAAAPGVQVALEAAVTLVEAALVAAEAVAAAVTSVAAVAAMQILRE